MDKRVVEKMIQRSDVCKLRVSRRQVRTIIFVAYCKIWSGVEWSGLEWICKTWSGFVKHGFVKGGFVKGGFVKHGFVKGGFVKGGFVKHGFVKGVFVKHGFVKHGFVKARPNKKSTGERAEQIFAGKKNVNNCQFQVFNGSVIFEGETRHRMIIESGKGLDKG